jgi:hypothetical protein
MNTRALNQTQPRRGIDHGSRYRGAPDQKHMGLADLLRKGPRLIEFFDHELGPKHSCDHVLNRQTGTGFLNDPSFYHQLVDQEIPSREPSLRSFMDLNCATKALIAIFKAKPRAGIALSRTIWTSPRLQANPTPANSAIGTPAPRS